MVQLSCLGAAVVNQSGAVEFRDHFKNEAISKSHTSRRNYLMLFVVFLLYSHFCYSQQNLDIGLVSTENTKQKILASGQGIEIDGVVWATSNVGIRGSFVSHSRESGGMFSTNDYDVCPAGWRLPTKEEFENLIKNSKEFASDGVFIGVAPNKIFLPFNKRDGEVNYWSGSYRLAERLIIRRPFKCRYYLSVSKDYGSDVVDGAMRELMPCRCVLDTEY
jgi:hypothetical protein